jgi:hypothetical protein
MRFAGRVDTGLGARFFFGFRGHAKFGRFAEQQLDKLENCCFLFLPTQ